MVSSRRRGAACVRPRAVMMSFQPRPSTEPLSAAQSLRELPRWMRLYFYGMHGVTLDVLLSSLQGVFKDRDPKLMGFSSVYLCIAHSLSHLVLEKLYSQKRCFRGRPVVFHLVVYPLVYIGLQFLIGNINALTWSSDSEPAPDMSHQHTPAAGLLLATQLAVHYLLSLYFAQVFHRGLSRLQYQPSCVKSAVPVKTRGSLHSLPGALRFLFFGMHGFLDEVLFTSVFNLVEKADGSMSGHTSLWSFLMYGSCSFVVEKLYLHLHFSRGWGTCKRLPLYICFAYTWEFCWGLVLRQFGACSWDYSHYPHNFMGLVTLLYLPGWVCLSLYQDVLTNVLLRIRCSKDVTDGRMNEVLNGQLEPSKKLM